MGKLRVMIVSEGRVVDIQEFDDPRLRYIEDFNQLNRSTPFVAVLPLGAETHSKPERGDRTCRPEERCRCSH